VEPLMVRVLGAYYVVGDAAIQTLRARRWSFGDIATAGNLAARGGRTFAAVARLYERRRDWVRVAREMGVAPTKIYLALNGPRAVVIGDMEEQIPPVAGGTERKREDPWTLPGGFAPARPGQRVAGARMEFVRPEPATLLRRAVASYYVLPEMTLRELQARGWSLDHVVVAGNVGIRSELTFEEIVTLWESHRDWPEVARRAGVDPSEIYQPTVPRRPATVGLDEEE
jgi:hypothetical protein